MQIGIILPQLTLLLYCNFRVEIQSQFIRLVNEYRGQLKNMKTIIIT